MDLSNIHKVDAVYRPNLLSSALINEGVTPIRQSTLDRFNSMRLTNGDGCSVITFDFILLFRNLNHPHIEIWVIDPGSEIDLSWLEGVFSWEMDVE